MKFIEHALEGVVEIVPRKFEDHRGSFSETYSRSALAERGIDVAFVQDNRSLSRKAGTVRGLHFQIPPFGQAKLVSALRGSILDVALDIRRGSPTFGRHVAVTLTAERGNQLFVPEGFAHGFCTLEPDVEIFYKVSNAYAPSHERAVLWNDPALGIAWPVAPDEATLSDKDLAAARLADVRDLF